MARILNTRKIDLFDPTAIRDEMVNVAEGIYLEERSRTSSDYFANIPVNKPVSEAPLDQLLAESYIDTPGVCRYGGHVLVQKSDRIRRYGAGEIKDIVLPDDLVILAVQPYLPIVPGITESGSLIQLGKPGLGTGRLEIGPGGFSLHSNMSLFVKNTGKYKGIYEPDFPESDFTILRNFLTMFRERVPS